ncbi:hypothetical protein PTSG_06555 [Salpingoeca rosetta]|uniref:DEP domain-containing protein n=1 Tax=Salpingoeca rosetta (strain ATCC 50818 / BSB-021) TaxID=946362 RepID=F2UG53_SALR5|nr:uncharacterized protein PTSG_06555 [Salpingoeca rosetta]EGD75481.1 hypothetical protein PTSG_06555 [Salpingoeca rosetta]|eukprot:XP_004991938.1 hypothetical protein PTSG_06555 [Salpingoeca rosetta]
MLRPSHCPRKTASVAAQREVSRSASSLSSVGSGMSESGSSRPSTSSSQSHLDDGRASPCRALSWVREAKQLPPQTRAYVLELAEAFRRSNLIGTRTYHLRTYHNVFVGREFVDWLLTQDGIGDRTAAISNAELLVTLGLAHHVCDDHPFKDDFLFYRFYADEAVNCPSVYTLVPAALHFGPLTLQSSMFNTRTYFALLAPRAEVLYLFKNDIGSSPVLELELDPRAPKPASAPLPNGFRVVGSQQKNGKHTRVTHTFTCASEEQLKPWVDILMQHDVLARRHSA